jgi:hypothetical protein
MVNRKEVPREEAIAAYTQIFREEPATKKYYTLIVRYAEEKGGLTLAFWKNFHGAPFLHPDFNHSDADPSPRTVAEVASRIGAPVSTLEKILNETEDAIRPEWMASAEYKQEQERQQKLREIEKTKPKQPPPPGPK